MKTDFKKRWADIRHILKDEDKSKEEFSKWFKEINIETMENKKLEWVLEFTQNPECSVSLCNNESIIIKTLANWLHLVGIIFL